MSLSGGEHAFPLLPVTIVNLTGEHRAFVVEHFITNNESVTAP